MTTTTTQYRYSFNGVISAEKTVMQNLEAMTNACGCWLSFDNHTGKWSVTINKPDNSKFSFTDDNILGAITVSGTGLTDLYNSVRVEFPHVDLNDSHDFVQDTIPEADRNANEPENTLVLQYDIVNDPIQAELLGLQELKQSRVDKIIKFDTDYSQLGVKAGDLIDVTSSIYGFTNKLFRVILVTENDADDGSLILNITAMEYDADVYSTDDLYRYDRTNSTGIITPGALPAPGQPQLSQFSNSSQPFLRMQSTITSSDANSLVEGVEFWYSQNQTDYFLIGSDRPANGRNFINGEVAEFDWISAPTGNIWVKSRSYNSVTTSVFSNVGSLQYQPLQITDAVSNNTVVTDETGSILPMLGAGALLALVNGMLEGDTGPGSLIQEANLVTGGGTYDGTWQGASRYVSQSAPAGSFKDGDVWFKV